MVLYGLVYADDEITMHGRPETGPKCCRSARPAVRADGANLGVIERAEQRSANAENLMSLSITVSLSCLVCLCFYSSRTDVTPHAEESGYEETTKAVGDDDAEPVT